jgi:hypothetical protein
MHAAWRCSTETGIIDFYRRAAAPAERVIAAFNPRFKFGFRTPTTQNPGVETWSDDGSFLSGAIGTALALHRFARDADPITPWDAALLLT